MMFAVVAYKHDAAARAFVERCLADGEEAALLTSADLSRPGWLYIGGAVSGRAVIDGLLIANHDIRAVITRVPALDEAELMHVHQEDRKYAVAEMQAFLLAWLTSLECPVLNRPSPSNLGGPLWSVAQWVQRAHRLGVAARPLVQRAVYTPGALHSTDCRVGADAVFVDVVGDRAFLSGGRVPGADEALLAEAAIALARDAGVEMVRIYFECSSEGTPLFLEASLWIDISAEPVAEALIDRCRGFPGVSRQPRPVRIAASVVEGT